MFQAAHVQKRHLEQGLVQVYVRQAALLLQTGCAALAVYQPLKDAVAEHQHVLVPLPHLPFAVGRFRGLQATVQLVDVNGLQTIIYDAVLETVPAGGYGRE